MHLSGQELCGKQRGAGLQGAARRQSETHKANRFRHKKQHSAGKQPLCAHLPIQRGVHCAECAALYPKKPYDTRRAKAGKRKQQQQRKAQKRRKQRRGKHLPKRAGASDAQKFGRVIRNKIPLLPSKCGRTQPGAQQDAGHQAKSKQRDASAFSAPSPLGHAKIFDCAPGPKRWPMAAKRKLAHRAHILFLFNRFLHKAQILKIRKKICTPLCGNFVLCETGINHKKPGIQLTFLWLSLHKMPAYPPTPPHSKMLPALMAVKVENDGWPCMAEKRPTKTTAMPPNNRPHNNPFLPCIRLVTVLPASTLKHNAPVPSGTVISKGISTRHKSAALAHKSPANTAVHTATPASRWPKSGLAFFCV